MNADTKSSISLDKRSAVVFPKHLKSLERLGENITLAIKRRKLTQDIMHKRTGLSKPTLRKICKGDPTVSIGHYVNVLAVLGLVEDVEVVARDDALGRKLQDIELLRSGRK
ncbi:MULTISPECIES: helix-turn-helix transcriptional regulator [Vibrio]|uniref:HTH cro/C1-type domain-containing protein n=1 Tax=Vibrio halioticoli NBRC 102217 TaxID=1219072 RepID=V5FIV9_9VIBR|nr:MULTISPECIES: helix-turn-helix transcriptional regulator [Vibrio]MPW36102.1 transcriptional regulator [Vibrio sp. B1Z05]GAD88877.1 hypothetical protein VHA01S_011_00170 [Vibrio halioticoli NBRC 102217]